MNAGSGRHGQVSEINVTPMIDVLLVLLVIFMVAQPLLQKSLDVQVPKEQADATTSPAPQIVLEIDAEGAYRINSQPVPAGRLEARLRAIYADRSDRVLFVKADPGVLYQDVITAMDAARGAGIEILGAVLPS